MKHWNVLVSGFLQLYHIPSNENPADLHMKFLGYQEAIPYLHPLLFWHGDMSDIPTKGSVN